MSAYSIADWSNFFVAETGAAAALTGLVIVAISINIATILEDRHLAARAVESIASLAGILLLSTFGIVPGQPVWVVGVEFLGVGVLMWAVTTVTLSTAFRGEYTYPRRWARILMGQCSSVPIVVAGASLLLKSGGGLYWLVPAVVMGLIGGIANTWVLLVEIRR